MRWIAAFLAAIFAFAVSSGLVRNVAAAWRVAGSTEMVTDTLAISIGIAVASTVGTMITPPQHRRVALPLFVAATFLWMVPSALFFGGPIMVGGLFAGAALSYLGLRCLLPAFAERIG